MTLKDLKSDIDNGVIVAASTPLAQRHGTSVDEIVTRELEDVACAHAQELADAVPSLAIGLGTA